MGPSRPLLVARTLHGTRAEGPGLRTAVWTSGCSIRCPGCINPHLWDATAGTELDVDETIRAALAAGVEGITLLGGEPFDQAGACHALANAARAAGLGVIVFTGFRHESLVGRDLATDALLASTDLLVDGAYLASSPDRERSLVGSTNQRFLHLTDRYVGFDPAGAPDRVELRIRPDGTVDVCGFAGSQQVRALAHALDQVSVPVRRDSHGRG